MLRACWFRCALVYVLTLCPSFVLAQDYSSRLRNLEGDRAYQQLLHAKIFNFGGVGWAPMITREEKAFHALLRSSNRTELLKRLLEKANPEGQLYALYGLYLEDADAFKKEAETLEQNDGPPARWEGLVFIEKSKVRTGEGCILSREDMRAVIQRIAKGEFDPAFNSSYPRLIY